MTSNEWPAMVWDTHKYSVQIKRADEWQTIGTYALSSAVRCANSAVESKGAENVRLVRN